MSQIIAHLSDALKEPDASKIYRQQILLTPTEMGKVEQFLRDHFVAEGKTAAQADTHREYRPNDLIFNQGDDADAIYFVVSGQVLCFLHKVERHFLALDITPGHGFFGEVGTIGYRLTDGGKRKRTASAHALTNATVLVLPERWVDDFIAQHPILFRKITSGMVERLDRSANDLHTARLRVETLEDQKKGDAQKTIHGKWVRMIGSYGFIGVALAGSALWYLGYINEVWDKNLQWFPLWLSLVQIVIGTLVLRSQLHLADAEAKPRELEQEANLYAEKEIHTVALELREALPTLLAMREQVDALTTAQAPAHVTAVAPVQSPTSVGNGAR